MEVWSKMADRWGIIVRIVSVALVCSFVVGDILVTLDIALNLTRRAENWIVGWTCILPLVLLNVTTFKIVSGIADSRRKRNRKVTNEK